MQERKPGCICQLDTNGTPTVENYSECQVHRPDAPTPKDSANRLIKQHYGLVAYEVMEPEQRKIAYDIAKQSASITVSEMLDILEAFKNDSYSNILIDFYQKVKSEIPYG